MLQQTQVSAVKDVFEKWMRDFPTVEALAEASEESVFEHWKGLGYYNRADNLLRTARLIRDFRNGKFPDSRYDLEAMPGIGAYTAGAILSLAFHRPEAILDGNLIRIFSRLYGWNFLPTDGASAKKSYWEKAKFWAKAKDAFLTNEALMELGRTVCKKAHPDCKRCPLQEVCRAFLENRQEELPPKRKVRHESWTGFALVLFDADGNILLKISPDSPFLKKHLTFPLFEYADVHRDVFPGIAEKIVPFENIKRFRFVGSVNHSITRYKISCRVLCAEVKTRKGIDGEWIPREKVSQKIVSSLGQKILAQANDF